MIPLAGNAQHWTAAEQEVLQAMNACLQASQDHDLEAWVACSHDDYTGWAYGRPAPINKTFLRKTAELSLAAGGELVSWSIQPLAMRIYGNVAVIHHYYYYLYRDPEGEEHDGRARWTDIMLKQGDRWVFIADHGGNDSMLHPAEP
jgi:hypothetical protein